MFTAPGKASDQRRSNRKNILRAEPSRDSDCRSLTPACQLTSESKIQSLDLASQAISLPWKAGDQSPGASYTSENFLSKTTPNSKPPLPRGHSGQLLNKSPQTPHPPARHRGLGRKSPVVG